MENRELLSGPTADEQYMLQLINLVRTNPTAAADRILSNLDANVTATVNYYNINVQSVKNLIASTPAQPPLAWNDALGNAAQGHSQDMNNAGVQSHTGSDGSSPQTRMQNAGYTNSATSGEDAYAYATSVDEAMQAFLLDWGVSSNGHRDNIIQPNTPGDQAYRDAGVGIVNSTKTGFGPAVITVDFGSQKNEQPTLLGVAYNDPNHVNFYTPGQGEAGVTVSATNLATGQTTSTQTQTAGGYEMSLAPGSYSVTASENGQVIRTQNVAIGNVNVEVDYNLSNPWKGGSVSSSVTPAAQTLAAPVTPPAAQTIAPATPAVHTDNAALLQPVTTPSNATSSSTGTPGLTWLTWTSWTAKTAS